MNEKHIVPLFTAQDWLKRFSTDMMGNASLLFGHTSAVEMFIHRLTAIKENSNSFEEIQESLTALLKEQKEFLVDFEEKIDGADPEKYGLPTLGRH